MFIDVTNGIESHNKKSFEFVFVGSSQQVIGCFCFFAHHENLARTKRGGGGGGHTNSNSTDTRLDSKTAPTASWENELASKAVATGEKKKTIGWKKNIELLFVGAKIGSVAVKDVDKKLPIIREFQVARKRKIRKSHSFCLLT